MSAESLGARLLAQVQENSLDQLLTKARQFLDPCPKGLLGLPQLDDILEAFRFPPADNTPQRQSWGSPSRNSNHSEDASDSDGSPIFARSQIYSQARPPMVELTSTRSASGKTNLLYYLSALAVIPTQYAGKDTVVVWFDTDGRFSAVRLVQVLQHHLTTEAPTLAPSDRSSLARSVLDRVHVFKSQSSTQLIATLKDLPDYLLHRTSTSSASRQLGLLVLDSATAFYWQDRLDADIARLEAGGTTSDSVSRTTEVISILKAIQDRFHCTVLFTTSLITSSFRLHPATATSINPQLPNASTRPQPPPVTQWTNTLATLTLTLTRTHTTPFHPAMTMTECAHDQPNRLHAVSRPRFVASVDPSLNRYYHSAVSSISSNINTTREPEPNTTTARIRGQPQTQIHRERTEPRVSGSGPKFGIGFTITDGVVMEQT